MKMNDLTGQRFDMLYVKCRASDYVSPKGYRKIMWECHCDCGNDCIIMGSHLTTGHSKSCGCQKTTKLTPRKTTDLTGQKFGMLKVMYREPNRYIGKNSRVVWHCKCECGKESSVLSLLLTNGLVKSCGCLNISHAERNMIQYLKDNHIDYIFQYCISELHGIGNGVLWFDFALLKENNLMMLIELDGMQHYKVIDYFGGIKKYEQTRANDVLKNTWTEQHGIKLIRIDVSGCKTDKSFMNLYKESLSSYISELTNSLNIG